MIENIGLFDIMMLMYRKRILQYSVPMYCPFDYIFLCGKISQSIKKGYTGGQCIEATVYRKDNKLEETSQKTNF